MICFIERINPLNNEIGWKCKVWAEEEHNEEKCFRKTYEEYIGKEFPTIKISNKKVLDEYNLIELKKEIYKELNILMTYNKDKRVKDLSYIIEHFLDDMDRKHYVFDVVEEE